MLTPQEEEGDDTDNVLAIPSDVEFVPLVGSRRNRAWKRTAQRVAIGAYLFGFGGGGVALLALLVAYHELLITLWPALFACAMGLAGVMLATGAAGAAALQSRRSWLQTLLGMLTISVVVAATAIIAVGYKDGTAEGLPALRSRWMAALREGNGTTLCSVQAQLHCSGWEVVCLSQIALVGRGGDGDHVAPPAPPSRFGTTSIEQAPGVAREAGLIVGVRSDETNATLPPGCPQCSGSLSVFGSCLAVIRGRISKATLAVTFGVGGASAAALGLFVFTVWLLRDAAAHEGNAGAMRDANGGAVFPVSRYF